MMKTLDQTEPRIPIGAPGYVITNAGSYYLTGNLTSPAGNGITVQADDVSIDLNGFALIGTGANNGILVSGTRTNLLVSNGTVRNWGSAVNAVNGNHSRFERLRVERSLTGLSGGTNAVVDHCQAFSCSSSGINVADGSLVQDCRAEKCGEGIKVGAHSIVLDCIARGGTLPISAGDSCLIQNCTAAQGTLGIATFANPRIINCVVSDNGSTGVQFTDGGTVKDCTIQNNGLGGISCFDNATITGCVISGNGFGGISARDGCKIKDCQVQDNSSGNGITVGNQSMVTDSAVYQNTGGRGIMASNMCVIARVNASLNPGGNQLEFGNYCQVLDNNCITTTNSSSSYYDLFAVGDHNYIQGNNGSFAGGLRVLGKTNIVVKNFSTLYINNTTNYFAPVVNNAGGITNGVNPFANFQP